MQTVKTWGHWMADLFWMLIEGLTWYVLAAILVGIIVIGIVVGTNLS